jgi:hypothetical protein
MWTALIVALSRGIRWWIYYLALEPFARRLYPHMLTSWSRGISGRYWDPLLGRDILIGTAVSVGTCLLIVSIRFFGTRWLGVTDHVPPLEFTVALQTLSGSRFLFGDLARWIQVGLGTIYWAFWIVLLRYLLRLDWLAVVAFVLLNGLARTSLADPLSLVYLIHFAAIAVVLTRLGVAAAGAFLFCSFVLRRFPMASDFTGPDVATSLFAVAAVVLLATCGFFLSSGTMQQRQGSPAR